MCWILLLIFMYLANSIQEISASVCHEVLKENSKLQVQSLYVQHSFLSRPGILKSDLTCYNVSTITNLNLPPNYVHRPQTYQQFLKIMDSNVSHLPKNGFASFHQIRKLYLTGIHLKTIDQGAFENLTILQELYLDDNELTELEDVFSPLRQLTSLILKGNKIVKIDKLAFKNNMYLYQLDLKHNLITELDKDIFKNLHLQMLDLSGNSLKTMPEAKVSILLLKDIGLTKFNINMTRWEIDNLNLGSNQLETFNFSPITRNLRQLDLSNNKIVSLENFESTNCDYINLKNNNIRKLNKTSDSLAELFLQQNKIQELEDTVFEKSKFLETLYLSYNEISIIGKNVFANLHSLIRLQLDHNKIKTIPIGLFRDLEMLIVLDLSSNEIENFQFGTFNGLENLRTLNLSINKLLSLDAHILHDLDNLYYLNLANNRITFLDGEYITSKFKNLREILLNQNLWHCKELVILLDKLSKIFTKVVDGDVFDRTNSHGIACFGGNSTFNYSGPSFKDYYSYIQGVIDHDVNKSEMNRFFEENLKNVELSHKSIANKISRETGNGGLVAISVIQIVMICLLLLALGLVYVFLKRIHLKHRAEVASRLELIADE